MKWKDSFDESQIEETSGKGMGGRTSKKSVMPTLLVGLWLVALTVLLVFLFMKTPPKSDGIQKGEFRKKIGQPATPPVEIADNKINEMINKINLLDKKLLNVEEQMRSFQKSIGEKITQIDKTKDVDLLMAKVEKLEKTAFLTDKPGETEILPEEQKDKAKPEKSDPDEAIGEEPEKEVLSDESSEKKATAKEAVETRVPAEKTFEEKVPNKKPFEIQAIAGELAKKKVAADSPDKERIVDSKPVVVKKRSVVHKKRGQKSAATHKSFKKKTYVKVRSTADREAIAAEYWLKRNLPTYGTDYLTDQRLIDREAIAAEYWLKRNLPTYTVQSSKVQERKMADSSSSQSGSKTTKSDYQRKPYISDNTPVKTDINNAVSKYESKVSGSQYHNVRSGETLDQISHRYGMTKDELIRLNKLDHGRFVYPGEQILVVPGGLEKISSGGTLYQISRRYDPIYSMRSDKVNSLSKFTLGLGTYSDRQLW